MSRLPALPNAVAPGALPPHPRSHSARPAGQMLANPDLPPPAAPADPRPDLAARFTDGARWTLLLALAHAADPAVCAALVELRQAGAQLVCIPQPGDLTPEGPVPLWQLAAGAIRTTDWPRHYQQLLAPHAPLLARWITSNNRKGGTRAS